MFLVCHAKGIESAVSMVSVQFSNAFAGMLLVSWVPRLGAVCVVERTGMPQKDQTGQGLVDSSVIHQRKSKAQLPSPATALRPSREHAAGVPKRSCTLPKGNRLGCDKPPAAGYRLHDLSLVL